ncbi:hypothetical protein QSV34_11110 [Porticoccus sp. W117]|uniref:hypothetical protein n=1 Tax=Porticoccus sp. W117 TaxID=3054777 RepID=UPI00259A11C3|nr:hypothetical protein [Porticoccus sp. W117]MDM3871900.1 hypothetical protein [Porticoccus sp. W117]
MADEIDCRAQFVGFLKGDHVFPDGEEASDGSQVFVSIETQWNSSTRLYGPMPSPVALFLNSAIRSYQTAIQLRNSFQIEGNEVSFTSFSTEFFDYIEALFESVIFSATSIEAFCNVHINDDQVFELKKNRCSEIYIGDQIERWISLDDKLSEIVAPKLNANLDKSTEIWSDYKNSLL